MDHLHSRYYIWNRIYNRRMLLSTIIKNICRERNFTVVKMSVSEKGRKYRSGLYELVLWTRPKRHEGVVFRFCEAIFPSVALACFLVPPRFLYAFTIIDTVPKLAAVIVSSWKYIFIFTTVPSSYSLLKLDLCCLNFA